MPLRPPNPLLATETVSVVNRPLVDGRSGDQKFGTAAAVEYPAIVTVQKVSTEGLRERAGTTMSRPLWDVVIFAASDPGVLPQKTVMTVVGQGRKLIAQQPSTYREAGAWYVLAASVE